MPPVPPPQITLQAVGPDQRAAAIGLVLTGRANPDSPAVRSFLTFAQEHQLDLRYLWWARERDRPTAGLVIIPGVGRTGMVFCSPPPGPHAADTLSQLVRHGLTDIDPQQINLVQALIDPGQPTRRQGLEDGGMAYLADLAYMKRTARRAQGPPVFRLDGQPLRLVHWNEQHRPLFKQAIQQSYIDTLDCPGLLGLRELDDVIAGHQATGRFDPQHWHVWVDAQDRPAAVLLLAASISSAGFELVYLGVSPHARRQGLARQMMELALDITARHSEPRTAANLQLAVDDRNQPALRLYRSLGFHTGERKTALIKSLT